MFIREQIGKYRELREEFAMEGEYLNIHVWSPVSCRHTNWTFEPKRSRVDWHITQGREMKKEVITVKTPLPKRRAGVMPTKTERDKSKDIPRKTKHKERLK